MKKYPINNSTRIPHENIYTSILTIIIAFAILWILYISVPYSPYRLYLIEEKNS